MFPQFFKKLMNLSVIPYLITLFFFEIFDQNTCKKKEFLMFKVTTKKIKIFNFQQYKKILLQFSF